MYYFNEFEIDMQLYLFDHVILLVALYGCEKLGFEKKPNY